MTSSRLANVRGWLVTRDSCCAAAGSPCGDRAYGWPGWWPHSPARCCRRARVFFVLASKILAPIGPTMRKPAVALWYSMRRLHLPAAGHFHVAYGSKADMATRFRHVRFTPGSDHRADMD